MSDPNKRGPSTGIHIEDSEGITMEGNEIRGFDRGIFAKNSRDIKAYRNIIEERTGTNPPQELIDATIKLLQEAGHAPNSAPTEADVNAAAERSGLKNWLVEHGVELAGFFVAIVSLFK